jgi:two-component system, OmpR family, sensor histidine kinase QseC
MTTREPASLRAVPRSRPLWRYLWGWATGALSLVWLALVAVAWFTGHNEAREITDGQLMATGRLWLATAPVGHRPVEKPLDRQGMGTYVQDAVVLQWDGPDLSIDTHGMADRLPFVGPPRPGLSTLALRPDPGQTQPSQWRMFAATDGTHHVAVLIDLDQRYDLATDLAQHMVSPALLIMPLVALGLWWAMRRGLRPLDRLSHDVASLDTRAGQRLLPHDRFTEFASTVRAINSLVDSLQTQAERERQFASDVAHELRTPLTSMALQARAARNTPSPERLDQLEREALRAGRILAQLLDMARAQRAAPDPGAAGEPVSLGEVASATVAAHAQLAYETQHELELVQPDWPVQQPTNRLLLELALRNLVENAIRHTPAGTQVVVEVFRNATDQGLSVSDDGHSRRASAAEHKDSDGLGLGLRLVERMAEQMGARFERGRAPEPLGTRFVLRWPRNG